MTSVLLTERSPALPDDVVQRSTGVDMIEGRWADGGRHSLDGGRGSDSRSVAREVTMALPRQPEELLSVVGYRVPLMTRPLQDPCYCVPHAPQLPRPHLALPPPHLLFLPPSLPPATPSQLTWSSIPLGRLIASLVPLALRCDAVVTRQRGTDAGSGGCVMASDYRLERPHPQSATEAK